MGETWNKLMGSYWKEQAKINKNRQIKADRHKEVYAGEGNKITCEDILEIYKAGGVILDLRNPVDYATSSIIHNSINVPARDTVKWLLSNHNITRSTPILLYCSDGRQSEEIKNDLKSTNLGFKNVSNIGSLKWYPNCS
jgi:rhodanese-related sulfurtransferase